MYCLIALLLGFCVLEYRGAISYKLMIIFMFLLMAYTVTTVDMAGYQGIFSKVQSLATINATDVGFGFLMYIAKAAGLNFFEFVRLITVIGLALLTYIFYRHSICPALVLALYFVFTFSTDTIQLRAFLANCILYLMMLNMIENGDVNPLHFFVSMAIALSLHASSVFFVLLLAVVFIKDRRQLFGIIMALCCMIPYASTILNFIPIAAVRNKVAIYLMGQRDSVSMAALIYVFLYIVITFVLLYVDYHTTDEKWKKQLDMLIKIHYICLISCVLIVVYTSNFYRITRTVIVVDFIVLGNYFIEKEIIRKDNAAIISAGVMMFFLAFEFLTGIWMQIMQNNSIFCQFI